MNLEQTQSSQEIPVIQIPEEVEQQKQREQQEVVKEVPIEKESTSRLEEINETIVKKKTFIQEAQQKINEIRGHLGLPPSDKIPPSMQLEQNALTQLNQEKNSLVNYSQESERTEELKQFENNVRSITDDISRVSKTMLDALYERQQGNLTPLQSGDHFQMMASHIKKLGNLDSKFDSDSITTVIEGVNKITNSFDTIKIQPVAQVRENPQNLEKLAYGAKQFSASVDESGRRLPTEMEDKQMEEKSKELRLALSKLSEKSQNLWLYAAKLRESSR